MNYIKTRFSKATKYLPLDIQMTIDNLDSEIRKSIQEIRLRLNRPICFTVKGESVEFSDDKSLKRILTQNDLEETFNKICGYSLHSYEEEIRNGFITVEGGHRIGFCGTKTECTVKYITSINIRIANEIYGCGEDIAKLFTAHKKSILIAGPPLSGKTTVLRDVTRIIGDSKKVCVIDERNEIAGTFEGKAQNNVGKYTDILNGYKKDVGIETATRVLSPSIIVCDEIGNKTEAKELIRSANTGVKFIATIHAENLDELLRKKYVNKMLSADIFRYIVLLDSGESVGSIKQIINTEDFYYENNRNASGNGMRLSCGKYLCK